MTATRALAIGLSAASAAAMGYVGVYQVRVIDRMVCPLFGGGCQAVSDAPFARPFGIADGFIAVGLYGAILLLLIAPAKPWTRTTLIALAVVAAVANALGVRDMIGFGAACFYCVLTTVLSPILLWAVWRRDRFERTPRRTVEDPGVKSPTVRVEAG